MDEKSAVQPQPPPKKSRWRISLRTAFILLTLACFALVYIARAEKQRRIVAQLNQWGFECYFTDRLRELKDSFGWNVEDDPDDPFEKSRWQMSLGYLGHYLDNVCTVRNRNGFDITRGDDSLKEFSLVPISQLTGIHTLSLKIRGMGDADLAPLARMHSLRSLELELPDVTDSGLVQIRPLTQLTDLMLRCHISDAGLKELSPLTNLRSLAIYDSAITDVGLAELPKHPHLEYVGVENAKGVLGPGIIHLAKLPRLRGLNLSGTTIRDDCLAQLPIIPALERIDLNQCSVGDAGVTHIARCKNVNYLGLNGTKITDRGVVELTKMPRLYFLFLDVKGVTDQGVLSLKRAPRLLIHQFSEDAISQKVRDEMSDFFCERRAASAQ